MSDNNRRPAGFHTPADGEGPCPCEHKFVQDKKCVLCDKEVDEGSETLIILSLPFTFPMQVVCKCKRPANFLSAEDVWPCPCGMDLFLEGNEVRARRDEERSLMLGTTERRSPPPPSELHNGDRLEVSSPDLFAMIGTPARMDPDNEAVREFAGPGNVQSKTGNFDLTDADAAAAADADLRQARASSEMQPLRPRVLQPEQPSDLLEPTGAQPPAPVGVVSFAALASTSGVGSPTGAQPVARPSSTGSASMEPEDKQWMAAGDAGHIDHNGIAIAHDDTQPRVDPQISAETAEVDPATFDRPGDPAGARMPSKATPRWGSWVVMTVLAVALGVVWVQKADKSEVKALGDKTIEATKSLARGQQRLDTTVYGQPGESGLYEKVNKVTLIVSGPDGKSGLAGKVERLSNRLDDETTGVVSRLDKVEITLKGKGRVVGLVPQVKRMNFRLTKLDHPKTGRVPALEKELSGAANTVSRISTAVDAAVRNTESANRAAQRAYELVRMRSTVLSAVVPPLQIKK